VRQRLEIEPKAQRHSKLSQYATFEIKQHFLILDGHFKSGTSLHTYIPNHPEAYFHLSSDVHIFED